MQDLRHRDQLGTEALDPAPDLGIALGREIILRVVSLQFGQVPDDG
jgi:hypothetical protein